MSEAGLYDRDFVLWSEEQGRRLRALAADRPNTDVDWENVAEEIETLGRSERREVTSLVQLILIHMLKFDLSPAPHPRAGWLSTIQRAQRDLKERLSTSPSLRPDLPAIIAREWPHARVAAATSLEVWAEFDAARTARRRRGPFTLAEVLGETE